MDVCALLISLFSYGRLCLISGSAMSKLNVRFGLVWFGLVIFDSAFLCLVMSAMYLCLV